MDSNPLSSLTHYSETITELIAQSSAERSTVAVWSTSPYTGIAEGEIFFARNFRLRIREEIDFAEALIVSYGYEVYRGDEKLYWYDDFPHPDDPTLASTFPHHKHVPPNIKRNRIPAPKLSFTEPNLPFLIQEVETLDD